MVVLFGGFGLVVVVVVIGLMCRVGELVGEDFPGGYAAIGLLLLH